MNGWDVGVYAAAAALIILPLGVFYLYLREIARRVKENDWGRTPPPTL
ncbi:MAG: hypothetical protein GX890_08355 [Firmicutes bacterium]|mgnify:CR=1 FL=1|jgi:ABC-type maltose transport system permease subunit|nr:hypothetical protein [Bacillota bacterium]HPU01549.1 hypothetical protein [Bacillota bacterium]